MAESWRAGKCVVTGKAETIADGIAVRVPVTVSVERIKNLVDEMVLVDDSQLMEAMRLSLTMLGVLLEPSGAAGLAAIRAHAIPGNLIATILTGSNIHPGMLSSVLRSGSAVTFNRLRC